MINIEERVSTRVPGETSFYLQFEYDPYKVEYIRSLKPSHFDKNTKEWEIPLSYLQNVIDEFTSLDDITLKTMHY